MTKTNCFFPFCCGILCYSVCISLEDTMVLSNGSEVLRDGSGSKGPVYAGSYALTACLKITRD